MSGCLLHCDFHRLTKFWIYFIWKFDSYVSFQIAISCALQIAVRIKPWVQSIAISFRVLFFQHVYQKIRIINFRIKYPKLMILYHWADCPDFWDRARYLTCPTYIHFDNYNTLGKISWRKTIPKCFVWKISTIAQKTFRRRKISSYV